MVTARTLRKDGIRFMNQKDVEKAKGYMERQRNYLCHYPQPGDEFYMELIKSYDIAIACMELQVGKIPQRHHIKGVLFFGCPDDNHKINYKDECCVKCGQRILWEIEDDE